VPSLRYLTAPELVAMGLSSPRSGTLSRHRRAERLRSGEETDFAPLVNALALFPSLAAVSLGLAGRASQCEALGEACLLVSSSRIRSWQIQLPRLNRTTCTR
jgi:hypothetical protein